MNHDGLAPHNLLSQLQAQIAAIDIRNTIFTACRFTVHSYKSIELTVSAGARMFDVGEEKKK
jgi:hypothetical protein